MKPKTTQDNHFSFTVPARFGGLMNLSRLQSIGLIAGFLITVLSLFASSWPINIVVATLSASTTLVLCYVNYGDNPLIYYLLDLFQYFYCNLITLKQQSYLLPQVHLKNQLSFSQIQIQAIGNQNIGIIKDIGSNKFATVFKIASDSILLCSKDEKLYVSESFSKFLSALSHDLDIKLIKLVQSACTINLETLEDDFSFSHNNLSNNNKVRCGELIKIVCEKSKSHSCHLIIVASLPKKTASSQDCDSYILEKIHQIYNLVKTVGTPQSLHGILSVNQLNIFIRRSWDPTSTQVSQYCWPTAIKQSWDHLKLGDIYSTFFWISHWPTTTVSGEFLAPLMLNAPIGIKLWTYFEPVESLRALKQSERHKTELLSSIALKEQIGIQAKALEKKHLEHINNRQNELLQGHAELKIHGIIEISANSLESLEASVNIIKRLSSQCYLDLRRLNGRHLQAYKTLYGSLRGIL
jgi:hypothetical protein